MKKRRFEIYMYNFYFIFFERKINDRKHILLPLTHSFRFILLLFFRWMFIIIYHSQNSINFIQKWAWYSKKKSFLVLVFFFQWRDLTHISLFSHIRFNSIKIECYFVKCFFFSLLILAYASFFWLPLGVALLLITN